jgi:hypothetical protein
MATERYVAGSLAASYTSAGFGTEINSLANGYTVAAGTAINNSTALDVFADFSISLGSVSGTSAGAPFLGLYLLPLNEDGTTYGDGAFSTVAVANTLVLPFGNYYAGSIPAIPSSTGVIVGTIRGIIMPIASFKFAIYNQSGVTLASGSNVLDYRTYNRQVS